MKKLQCFGCNDHSKGLDFEGKLITKHVKAFIK